MTEIMRELDQQSISKRMRTEIATLGEFGLIRPPHRGH